MYMFTTSISKLYNAEREFSVVVAAAVVLCIVCTMRENVLSTVPAQFAHSVPHITTEN